MDFGIIAGVNPPDPDAGSPGVPPYNAFEAARYAMGDTLHYAQKMNLILQPGEKAGSFTVKLEAGTYKVEWFGVNSRKVENVSNLTVESDGNTSFSSPFAKAEPVVLYLNREGD